jgi:hypothetical protein
MIKVTQAILTRVISERPVLAELLALEIGNRDPEQVEKILKEKPPLEAIQLIQRLNAEACGKYKTSIRVSRRTLDSWDTILLAAGSLATFFILIGLIFTAFKVFVAALILGVLALLAGAMSALFTYRTRGLRTDIERQITIQNEHCQDAAQLDSLLGALTGISVDEAQKLIQRFLFTEES